MNGNAGADDLNVTGNVASITVNGGDGNDDIDVSAAASATAINAGAGNDDLDYSAIALTQDVDMGAGNDTVTLIASVTGDFDGGDGTDTLDLAGASAATFSNFETVTAATVTGAATESFNGGGFVLTGNSVAFAASGINEVNLAGINVDASGTFTWITGLDSTVYGSATGITYTGSGTWANTVTGTANADQIIGGDGVDTISTGGGADTISVGAGNDIITGGAGDSTITLGAGADQFTSGAGDESVDVGSDSDIDAMTLVAANGVDTFSNFDSGEDTIDVTTNVLGAAITASLAITTAQAAHGAVDDDDVFYVTTDGTAASLTTSGTATLDAADYTATTLTDVASFLDEQFDAGNVATEEAMFVINDTTGGNAYVYNFIDAGGDTTVDAAELTLFAVVNDTLTSGDIV